MSDHQENGTGGGRNAPTLNQDEYVRRVFGVDVIMRRRAGGMTGVMGGSRRQAPPPPPLDMAPPPPPPPPPPPNPGLNVELPDLSLPFRQAYALASATLLEAEHVRVASPMLPGAVAQYAGLLETMRAAEQNQNWDGALVALQQALPLARKLLIVQQRRVQAPQEKLVFQLEQYNEIAPILQRVRKSYFPSGGAQNLRESDLSAGGQFKDYIEAVAGLEQAKGGNNPAEVKQAAERVIAAANIYLDHYKEDLSDHQQNDKKSLRKKQICEEGIKAARHMAMAADLESLGQPEPGNLWGDDKQLRATQLRAQFGFETGMQKGAPLGGGQEGRNKAFWVESTEFGENGNSKAKNFIFKPINPELPDTMQEATRESVAFATSQMIAQQTGLHLGVPESSVATIGSYALELPEGPAPNQMVGSLQKYEKSSGDFTAQGRDFANEVSPEECQRAAIVDIIGLNMDRTPQNFLIGRGENGDEPPKLIAIDNGLSLPSVEKFLETPGAIGGMDSTYCNPRNALLMLSGTFEKFSQDAIDRLALLDPEAIAQGTRDHLASLDQVNPGLNARANLPDSAIELSKRTAILLKKAAPELSPGEVMIAISKFAPELANFNLDAEELAQRIIDEQKPLGAGYVLMMTASSQVRQTVARTLRENGWGNGADLIMQDPVAALRLAQAGVRNEGNDNASEIAGNLDMAGILTPKVNALRNEFDTIIDYAVPGDVAGFRQQLVQLGDQPEDVNALSGFLLRLTTLRTDVVSSCSGQIRGEADRLVVDMRNRGGLGEQEMRQYEERAQFRVGVRPDREQSPQTLQTAIEGLLWLREQALRLPPL